MATETISHVLLLTPPGVGAIAVVCIDGPKVDSFLATHFSRPARVGRLTHGELRQGDQLIDDPLVARLSDTVADINLHGGVWVVQRAIDLAVRFGFDPADVRQSAFDIDSGDELEAEMLQWLSSATTELAIRKLLAQPAAWKRMLAPPMDAAAVHAAVVDRSLHWLLHPPRIAIIGPPNVGKSTLANEFFGQARSITADVPGTTRDWVGELANIDGLPAMLIDTPGVRTSDDAIEMKAIAQASGQIDAADLVIIISDATRPTDPTVAALQRKHPNAIRVVNKIDLAPSVAGYGISAVTGHGVDRLRNLIRDRFLGTNFQISSPCCWTDRQRSHLSRMAEQV